MPIQRSGRLGDVNGNCLVDIDDLVAVVTSYCANHCPHPTLCCSGCIPTTQCDPEGAMSGMSVPNGADGNLPISMAQMIELVLESDLPSAVQADEISQILMHFSSQY